MPTLSETLALAWQYQQSRNFAQMELLCRQILAADAGQAEAWRLLGKAAQAQGRIDEAIAHFQRALQLQPDGAETYSDLGIAQAGAGQLELATATFMEGLRRRTGNANAANNLGVILAMQARPAEAIDCFREAIRAQPTNADYHCNLANALFDTGRHHDAVASYRQVLQLQPNSAAARTGLANALRQLGDPGEAEAQYRESLRLAPNFLKAWHGLGVLMADQQRFEDATHCFREALRLKPDFAEAHHGMGMALADQFKLDEAVACYRQALRCKPDFADAHNNLGNALLLQEKPDEAIASYERALRLLPNFPQAHKNLANAFYVQGKFDLAMAQHGKALALNPDYAEVHYNRSLLRLLTGDYEQGWPEYEWRWTQPGFVRRDFAQPRWDGSPLNGRTILLYHEQGLGDTIQFVRYAALVKKGGGQVIVQCQHSLMRLLANVDGIDQLVPERYPVPPFDVQAPLLSLPGIFQTRLGTIPATPGYITADPDLVLHWRGQLRELNGFKIGIVWQGSTLHPGDRRRSTPLTQFEPLAQVESVCLVSLQVGAGTDQLRDGTCRFPVLNLESQLGTVMESFGNIAAIMKNLDLVICCDTAVGHLAGALNVPVWVAVALVPDWRWLQQGERTRWYPSMRLFRQTHQGQWQDVFERMAGELRTGLTNQSPSS